MTGFRVSAAGWYGLDGVRGDLVTFGKVMGGGLPGAAFGGRAEIMARLAPSARSTRRARCPVTRSPPPPGWPPCAPARPRCTARSTRSRARCRKLVSAELAAGRRAAHLSTAGNLFSVFLPDRPVTDFADAKDQSTAAYSAFFHAMLDGGVYLPPSAFEAWFPPPPTTTRQLARVAAAAPGRAPARPGRSACRLAGP